MNATLKMRCGGKFARQGSTERTVYCTHPGAKQYLCPELVERELCPSDLSIPAPTKTKSDKQSGWKDAPKKKSKKTERSAV